MRTLFVTLVLVGLLACVPSAQAVPMASISWDQCSPIVYNKAFIGPGSYSLYVSAVGLEGSYACYDVILWVVASPGAPFPDAWSFWTDEPGCQPPVEFSNHGTTPACATFLGPAPLSITGMQPDIQRATSFIRAAVCFDNIPAAPAQRYLLWRMTFDHNRSVIGESDPSAATCGHAETPLCFSLEWVQFLTGNDVIVYSDFENQTITWQDGSSFGSPCMNPVRTQSTTWGRVKSLYR